MPRALGARLSVHRRRDYAKDEGRSIGGEPRFPSYRSFAPITQKLTPWSPLLTIGIPFKRTDSLNTVIWARSAVFVKNECGLPGLPLPEKERTFQNTNFFAQPSGFAQKRSRRIVRRALRAVFVSANTTPWQIHPSRARSWRVLGQPPAGHRLCRRR